MSILLFPILMAYPNPPVAKEAQALVTYHRFSVTTLVGGTNMVPDKRALLSPTGCDIVVATPGRMLAHMQETPGVPQLCSGVKVSGWVVVDEPGHVCFSISCQTQTLIPSLASIL